MFLMLKWYCTEVHTIKHVTSFGRNSALHKTHLNLPGVLLLALNCSISPKYFINEIYSLYYLISFKIIIFGGK